LASGRYMLLLNPDTLILDDAISRCVQYADLHSDVGVVGCQVLENENCISNTGFTFPTPWNVFLALSGLSRAFPRSRLFGRPEMSWWKRDSEEDVDVIAGMFMLVRREAIAQVGLLDEAYFVYSEETARVHTLCAGLASRWWSKEHLTSKYQNVRPDAEELDDLSPKKPGVYRVGLG
jgi:GT2 family glycosyltransferase